LTGYEQGVAKTRQGVFARLRGVLGGPMSDADWEDVEEALIMADIGAILAGEVVERARARRDVADARAAVEAELLALFAPRDPTPWPRVPAPGVPAVVLVVGVNGTGKTTTVAKLGNRFARRGAKVILAAADTFRAAATEQLETWAARAQLPVVAHQAGADPSAVVVAHARRDEVERRVGELGETAVLLEIAERARALRQEDVGADAVGGRLLLDQQGQVGGAPVLDVHVDAGLVGEGVEDRLHQILGASRVDGDAVRSGARCVLVVTAAAGGGEGEGDDGGGDVEGVGSRHRGSVDQP